MKFLVTLYTLKPRAFADCEIYSKANNDLTIEKNPKVDSMPRMQKHVKGLYLRLFNSMYPSTTYNVKKNAVLCARRRNRRSSDHSGMQWNVSTPWLRGRRFINQRFQPFHDIGK